MPKYSISQIKQAHIQKRDWEKQFLTIRYFSRPISFYLTYLIIQITENPAHIVWAGFAIGLLGCLSFLFIPCLTIWTGISLLITFSILDAVDGNIARVTKNVTYYGKFLDGIIGEIIEGGYCFWLGLGLYVNSGYAGRISILLAGVIIMTARLYSNLFQGGYYTNLILKQEEKGISEGKITDNLKSSIYRKHWWYLLFINMHTLTLQLLLLVICAAFKVVDLFLFFFAAYYPFRSLVMMVFYTYRAQRRLNE